MAMMKLCRCGKVIGVRDDHCNDCIDRIAQDRREYHRQYDRYSRDIDSATFYNSSEWKRARQHMLMMYKGLDLYAYFIDNEIEYADTAHHIVELKDDWSKRLTIANLFPCTVGNHKRIHKLYDKNKKETQKLLFNLIKKYENLYGRGI